MISSYTECNARETYGQLVSQVREACILAARECDSCVEECRHFGGMSKSICILKKCSRSLTLHADLLAQGNHTGTREAIAMSELCAIEYGRIIRMTEIWFSLTPLSHRCLELCLQLEQSRQQPIQTGKHHDEQTRPNHF